MNTTKGLVVPAGGGKHLDMTTPGRFAALKLLGHETNASVMLFEETIPAGTKSLFHQHRDSDEVAWILAGEITFRIGDEVTVGGPGTCAFFPRNVPHAWKNARSSASVTAGKSSAQTRFEGWRRIEPLEETATAPQATRGEVTASRQLSCSTGSPGKPSTGT